MGIEILVSILGGLLSLTVGGVLSSEISRKLVRPILNRVFGIENPQDNLSYAEKLSKLTENLTTASREVDEVLLELSEIAKDRERAVQKIEGDLQNLQNREKELQDRIETLQNVPLPVAEHFAKLTTPGETRSARRDYILFGSGVVVSTIIAILLKLFGLG